MKQLCKTIQADVILTDYICKNHWNTFMYIVMGVKMVKDPLLSNSCKRAFMFFMLSNESDNIEESEKLANIARETMKNIGHSAEIICKQTLGKHCIFR